MSEAELHLIRARLDGGLRNKAARGELRLALPVGLDRDEDGRIVLCPDEQVRHAIERVFALWRRLGLGAAGRVGADRRGAAAAAPDGRAAADPVGARELWRGARLLDQPGVCGRVRVRPHTPARSASTSTGGCASATSRCRSRSGLSACPSTIPAMSSWDEYLADPRAAASERETARRGRRRRARGRARCCRAWCAAGAADAGCRSRYSGTERQASAGMRACAATTCMRPARPASRSAARGWTRPSPTRSWRPSRRPGSRRPPARSASSRTSTTQRLAGQRLAVERAEFEADRARRQFDACEPEHRLVARTLERALEDALAALERERGKLAALEQRPAGAADRPRARSARPARARPAAAVGRADDDRPRPQGAAAHADQRGDRHRPRTTNAAPTSRSLGRRRAHRTDASALNAPRRPSAAAPPRTRSS